MAAVTKFTIVLFLVIGAFLHAACGQSLVEAPSGGSTLPSTAAPSGTNPATTIPAATLGPMKDLPDSLTGPAVSNPSPPPTPSLPNTPTTSTTAGSGSPGVPPVSTVSATPQAAPEATAAVPSQAAIPATTQSQSSSSLPTNREVRWCVTSARENEFCQTLIMYLQPVNPAYHWSCVQKASYNECIDAIDSLVPAVDMVSLDPGWMFYAFYYRRMKLIAVEDIPHGYLPYAVVVVNAALCDKQARDKKRPLLQMSDLQGLRACLPGYRLAAGWNIPAKYLLENKLATPKNRNPSLRNDIEMMQSFFSKACMPSQVADVSICSSCTDQCTISPGQKSIYEGYVGAFRCLMEGKGDVAFLRDGVVGDYSESGRMALLWEQKFNSTWTNMRMADQFRLLCPDGGCRPISDGPLGCSLGTTRDAGIMVRNNLPEDVKATILTALETASRENYDFKGLVQEGKNVEELIFSSAMAGIEIWRNLTRDYLQAPKDSVDMVASWEALENLNNMTVSSAGRLSGEGSSLFRMMQLAVTVVICTIVLVLS